LIGLLRLGLTVSATRMLLDKSRYIADLGLPETPQWTTAQTWLILGGSSAVLAVVWAALLVLARRGAHRSVPLSVALTCAGAALVLMMSGNLTDGQLGLPLGAALVGAVAASLLMSTTPNLNGVLSLGVVGLFSLLILGRFFAELTTLNAALLFVAPLLCWLPELPPRFRSVVRVAWAAVPIVVALTMAYGTYMRTSTPQQFGVPERPMPKSSGAPEPSAQDYLDYKK
jgi:hypothetical protein